MKMQSASHLRRKWAAAGLAGWRGLRVVLAGFAAVLGVACAVLVGLVVWLWANSLHQGLEIRGDHQDAAISDHWRAEFLRGGVWVKRLREVYSPPRGWYSTLIDNSDFYEVWRTDGQWEKRLLRGGSEELRYGFYYKADRFEKGPPPPSRGSFDISGAAARGSVYRVPLLAIAAGLCILPGLILLRSWARRRRSVVWWRRVGSWGWNGIVRITLWGSALVLVLLIWVILRSCWITTHFRLSHREHLALPAGLQQVENELTMDRGGWLFSGKRMTDNGSEQALYSLQHDHWNAVQGGAMASAQPAFLGFICIYSKTGTSCTWEVRVPHWAVVGLLLSAPLMEWMFRVRKRKMQAYRSKHGLCVACGYDLRQSSGRCPECGRRVAAI